MTTITALNVRLGMDASNFSAGADLARTEVNRVASIMRQSVPPAEKYKQELDLLNKAFSEAGKQTAQYANAVEHLKRKHGQATPAISQTKNVIDQMKQSMLSAVPGGNMLANAIKGPVGAALALAAAVGIMARGISQAATRIDEAAKAARSLGTSYSELISLQMLASEVAGINADSLNKGLGQFVKRLAEARVNGGALSETLRAIGLDAAQLAAMNPAEAWKLAADAIAAIPDKAEQIRVSVALFGKEGIKFVELMRLGGDALEQMNKEADRLGLTMSAEAAASVEAMNDAFGRVGNSVEGIWNSLVTALAPTLTLVAKLVEEVFVFIRSATAATPGLSEAFAGVGFIVHAIVDGLRAIVAMANDLMQLLGSLPGWLVGGELNTSFSESNRLLDELEGSANGTAEATAAATEAAAELAIEAERAAEAAAKQQEQFEKRLHQLEIEKIELQGNTELARKMRLEAEGYTEAQAAALMAMEDQNEAIRAQISSQKDLERAEKDRVKAVDQAEKEFQKELETARKAAMDFFDEQKKKNDERRAEIAKGPGAGMEAGSAEAAKFMADAVNRSISMSAVPDDPVRLQQEVAEKTAELLIAQREANAKQAQQIELARMQLDEMKNNKFTRFR
jgi:hypothetical protein